MKTRTAKQSLPGIVNLSRKIEKLFDLKPCHCRWPVGSEIPVKWFCGGRAIDGLPYCPRHCRIAYLPLTHLNPQERTKRALWWKRQFTPSPL